MCNSTVFKSLVVVWLGLGASVRADVTLYSVCPHEVKARAGNREETVGSMQSISLPCREPALEVTLMDEEGKTLFQGKLANEMCWVVHPDKGKTAGCREAGRRALPANQTRQALGFFNSTPYNLILSLVSNTTSDTLDPVVVESLRVSEPLDVPEGTFTVYLKDEGGNPIGRSYSKVSGGRTYVLFRKHDTLYDVEALGSLPRNK